MAVAENGRRALGPVRGTDLADRERLPVPVDDLALAAGRAHEVAHPLAGANDVAFVHVVRADRGDPQELGELVDPLGHAGEPSAPAAALVRGARARRARAPARAR